MKKFLLLSFFAVSLISANAQTVSCPTNAKRNNGNSCTSGGTGGQLEVEFPNAPDVRLQIALIANANGTATIIESTKTVSTRAGKTYITWCFETDNLGPIVQGSVVYQFYLDYNGNNQQDIGPYIWNGVTVNEQSFLCSQASLPVTLVSFDALQKSGKVVLNWATILELNNSGFDVERKIGNGQYQKIAFVASKAPGGNGAAYSYAFEDAATLPNGPVYYRIRQVDFDGHSVYSEVRAIRIGNGTLTLMVYPNPSRGTTNVAIPSGIGSVDVSVDDVTGKSVQRFSNLNTSSLQLTNLKAGMYFIRVKVNSTGETITERLAVQ